MSLDAESPNLPPLNNITIVVKDIEKTAQSLSLLLGIGPWEVMEYAPTQDELMGGQPFKLKFAFTSLGTVTLQLTQPIEGQSLWQAFLDEKGEGLHNLYFEVPNWEETIARFKAQGNTILASGRLEGKRWCVFESAPGGVRIELGES
jgi:methylmalonyl-CoA/ethylmalonyl-CoA epimerase